MRSQFTSLTPGASMVGGAYDEQIRQNLALFDRAMKMFSPFAFANTDEPGAAAPSAPRAEAAPPPADDALIELRKRMEEMQAQIEKLAGKR